MKQSDSPSTLDTYWEERDHSNTDDTTNYYDTPKYVVDVLEGAMSKANRRFPRAVSKKSPTRTKESSTAKTIRSYTALAEILGARGARILYKIFIMILQRCCIFGMHCLKRTTKNIENFSILICSTRRCNKSRYY